MTKGIIYLLILAAVLSSDIVMAGSTDKEKAAVLAAKQWLALADEGRYADSWKEAAGYFKNSVAQKQWVQSLESVRTPLGKMVSRTVRSSNYMTSLPGAPDGEYVVIQFESSFTNKKSAIETVTPMFEKDGRWRVSGYYIK